MANADNQSLKYPDFTVFMVSFNTLDLDAEHRISCDSSPAQLPFFPRHSLRQQGHFLWTNSFKPVADGTLAPKSSATGKGKIKIRLSYQAHVHYTSNDDL
jgi:hypothetical protein